MKLLERISRREMAVYIAVILLSAAAGWLCSDYGDVVAWMFDPSYATYAPLWGAR